LAAKTLFDALRASGIDPEAQLYVNLFDERYLALHVCQGTLRRLQRLAQTHPLVALGTPVHLALARAAIPHLALVHPAARGRIRGSARYQAHVRAVLADAAQR
jgi:hypothetical protein